MADGFFSSSWRILRAVQLRAKPQWAPLDESRRGWAAMPMCRPVIAQTAPEAAIRKTTLSPLARRSSAERQARACSITMLMPSKVCVFVITLWHNMIGYLRVLGQCICVFGQYSYRICRFATDILTETRGRPHARRRVPSRRSNYLKMTTTYLSVEPESWVPPAPPWFLGLVKKVRRNLPICTSSPLTSTAESTTSRLT